MSVYHTVLGTKLYSTGKGHRKTMSFLILSEEYLRTRGKESRKTNYPSPIVFLILKWTLGIHSSYRIIFFNDFSNELQYTLVLLILFKIIRACLMMDNSSFFILFFNFQ